MIALWVALGAALGAPTRYLTDRALTRHVPGSVPLGTLLVNLVASAVLGAVTGVADAPAAVVAALGTGFCGALSTWSTLAYEVVALASRRRRAVAVGYLASTVVAGVVLAALGHSLTA